MEHQMEADFDRLESKTRGGNVVDLDAYRARAETVYSTAAPFLSIGKVTILGWVFLALVVLYFLRRA
jgi:hypothetical protein